MLKYSAEQLDYISISAADAQKELLKCKKILKPKTCACNRTCTCQSCNELDSNLRDIQEIVQACNFNNHISAIENTLRPLQSAYRSYKSTHGDQWDIWYIATCINFLDQSNHHHISYSTLYFNMYTYIYVHVHVLIHLQRKQPTHMINFNGIYPVYPPQSNHSSGTIHL